VVLWVDMANAPARALYARAGFTERGWDVALER
jgi:predicted GNAT family acetyltransferase